MTSDREVEIAAAGKDSPKSSLQRRALEEDNGPSSFGSDRRCTLNRALHCLSR
jgi:hypothetical protein